MVTDQEALDDDGEGVSNWFWVLASLAVAFFLLSIAGIGLLMGIVIFPQSWAGDLLITIINVGLGDASARGLGSGFELLIGGIGTSGSLSLSLALAAIYVNQNGILQTQTEIQQLHADIMRREKYPILAAHSSGVGFHDGKPTLCSHEEEGELDISTSENGPHVSIAVENHGDETAEQAQLACLVDTPEPDDETTLLPNVAKLTADGMYTTPPKGHGALLPPTNGLDLLYTTPVLSSSRGSTSTSTMFVGGIEDVLRDIDWDGGADPPVVRFGFVLIFSNSMNDRFKIPLESAYSISVSEVDESEDLTLTGLRQKAVTYNINDLIEDLDWSIPEDEFVNR